MELGWRHALAGAAVLFFAFLLFKMRPARRRRDPFAAERRLQAERARRATTPEDKAAALCEAGAIAARGAAWSAAAGFFFRAMRADPISASVIERAIAALARPAPRQLEQALWKRLSVLPWDGAHRASARAAVIGLRDLYSGKRRDRSRAEMMHKLSQKLEEAGEGLPSAPRHADEP